MPKATADHSQAIGLDADLADIANALASVQGEIQDAVNWVDSAFGTAKPARIRFQPVSLIRAWLRRDTRDDDVGFELSTERA